MDSDELTTEQARQMNVSLFRVANYLHRSSSGWKNGDFPRAIDSTSYAKRAYDAVCSLGVELHYVSCKSRVGKTRKEK